MTDTLTEPNITELFLDNGNQAALGKLALGPEIILVTIASRGVIDDRYPDMVLDCKTFKIPDESKIALAGVFDINRINTIVASRFRTETPTNRTSRLAIELDESIERLQDRRTYSLLRSIYLASMFGKLDLKDPINYARLVKALNSSIGIFREIGTKSTIVKLMEKHYF